VVFVEAAYGHEVLENNTTRNNGSAPLFFQLCARGARRKQPWQKP